MTCGKGEGTCKLGQDELFPYRMKGKVRLHGLSFSLPVSICAGLSSKP